MLFFSVKVMNEHWLVVFFIAFSRLCMSQTFLHGTNNVEKKSQKKKKSQSIFK